LQRAIDIVRSCRTDAAAHIVDNLYRAVRDFCKNRSQDDDITAVVIKVRESLDRSPSRGPLQSNHAEDAQLKPHSLSPEHRA
jgi:hypothetical protein